MSPSISRRKFLSFSLGSLIAGCGGGSSSDAEHGAQTPPVNSDTATDTTTHAPPKETGDTPSPNPPSPVQPDPVQNVVQRENAKGTGQGVTSQWQIADQDYASKHEIEGYASATSVNRGDSIKLYVNTSDPQYTIEIYRIGWYDGQGGRLVHGPITRVGVQQPAPSHDADTNLIECAWTDPYEVDVPSTPSDPTDWASGVYLAKLAGSSGKQSYIIFVVRDDARTSDLLFQSSVTTYAAYNNWGGYSLYSLGVYEPDGKGAVGYEVSFNRPYRNPMRPSFGKGAGDFLSWEINLVRFLEREGFDVTYLTNIDTDRAPQQLQKYHGFLSVGHDEYWTKNMRDAVEGARDNGVHLAFFGANTGYWQIRLGNDSNGQPSRTVVCYKYAFENDPMYKTNPELTTYLWRAAPMNRPEEELVGVTYQYNSVDLDMVIDDCQSLSWIFSGTGLQKGSVLKGMLGYEVDAITTSSPAGIVTLAASPYTCATDPTCPTTGTNYSNMTYYSVSNGAGVFATGSMNWHWGLDSFVDGPRNSNPDSGKPDNRETSEVQMITRNILAHCVNQ